MTAAEIRRLATLGLTADQIAVVAEMLECRPPGDSKAVERTRRYRARLDVSPSDWAKIREQVLTRDKWLCRYCGSDGAGNPMHCDHVVPISRGGRSDLQNLVAACGFCNSSKSGKLLTEWKRK